jgi:hypothetical protein
MNRCPDKYVAGYVVVTLACWLGATEALQAADATPRLVFSAAADNDLYRVLTACGQSCSRYDTPTEAVQKASPGAGVLILADGYPQKTTPLDASVFDEAARKKLRLYVEYPATLPDTQVGQPRVVLESPLKHAGDASAASMLERVVVSADVFGESLPKMRLLALHDCHFVEVQAEKPYLVAARVAGYDTAVFGIDDVQTWPILFEHPRGGILVSTTRLSQFVTARYAPYDAMQAVWRMILGWLQPESPAPLLTWQPTVRPTYSREAQLPTGAVRQAVIRGIDWHTKAQMLPDAESQERYTDLDQPIIQLQRPAGSRLTQQSAGDGKYALREGLNSRIYSTGKQKVRAAVRTDVVGESALAFALRWKVDGEERSRQISGNLLDWIYFTSPFFQKDPTKANFGSLYWCANNPSLYSVNDCYVILSTMGTAALLDTDRWDESMLQLIMSNFRTTGIHGFRSTLDNRQVLAKGWEHFWRSKTPFHMPHLHAGIWACYLWLYDKTGDRILFDRTRKAIATAMEGYPDNYQWANTMRSRMLLPLAWLVRVDDRPEHRAWLKLMADDIRKYQEPCGAIREVLGTLDPKKTNYRPPNSNAEYGKHEGPVIQHNGDPATDMLYGCNFLVFSLHEAYAATGDSQYREMEDKLVDFLVRIQITSQQHPELDGGWFRAFDYRKWDYWGSNAGAGWGAWTIEAGWTQAWIPTTLALHELDTSLWDLSKHSRVAKHWQKCRKQMLPDEVLQASETRGVQ